MRDKEKFWESKTLGEMSDSEWESLCDGCAKCCVKKLEDVDTGDVHYTNVACHLLDREKCRCTRYPERSALVPDCIVVTPDVAADFKWLPETCAYRLLAEGKPLYDWHPLISGNWESVHAAGVSVRGKVISDENVHPDEIQEFVIKWIR